MATENKIFIEKKKLPVVAIVGRPNVGKSSLFNRILHRKIAVIHDLPGVTRDRHYAPFEWNGVNFLLVDTGGLLPNPRNELEFGVVRQIEAAIAEARLLLFLIEPELHPDDFLVADMLRKTEIPAIVAINKVDNPEDTWSGAEAEGFGLGEVIRVSAKFGHGTGELLDEITGKINLVPDIEEQSDTIQLAIVGRPNVGKSSFLNRLLGEEVALVHPKPGTTRDPVNVKLKYFGMTYEVVDTAGLFRKQRDIEYFSALRTIRVIEESDVVLLILDAKDKITRQDKRIASMALERLRGLVIAVNKWDLIEEKNAGIVREFEEKIKLDAPFLKFVPIVFISCLTGQRVRSAMEIVHRVALRRRERISTSIINELIHHLQIGHPPPIYKGRRPKILYATQTDISPPEFVFFSKMPKAISPSYKRYITNQIRKRFDFEGVAFKLVFRDKGR